MKIAYLITRMDEYGGAQIHVRDLSQWMVQNGHDVTVMSGKAGRVFDEIKNNGVHCVEISELKRPVHILKDWRAFVQIRRALQDIRPDIVSCHSSKAGLIGRLAARSLGIKVIFTAHGWSFTTGVPYHKRMVYRALEKFAALFGDHIITVSHFDRDLAIRYNIAPSNKMTAIHNAMLPLPLRRSVTNINPQLVMVARFGPQKDHYTLLNALARLRDKSWHLHLVGNGDDNAVKQQAEQLQLSEKITFHGERHDVPEFLSRQDIFLLISHWEGFPRAILEAMRAGLPVITTETAGSPESVDDGETGYVVPEHDPVELAEKIRILLDDAELRVAMGKAGRKRFEEDFTFDKMADKTLAIYQNVTGKIPTKPTASKEQNHRKIG